MRQLRVAWRGCCGRCRRSQRAVQMLAAGSALATWRRVTA
jgi:hypothetical protein